MNEKLLNLNKFREEKKTKIKINDAKPSKHSITRSKSRRNFFFDAHIRYTKDNLKVVLHQELLMAFEVFLREKQRETFSAGLIYLYIY
jgi:hypothetical protein